MDFRELGELGFIERLKKRLPQGDEVERAIAEDCAVLSPQGRSKLLFTTDMLMEGIHFDLAFISPEQLGHKALAVNISDVAAMGGRPLFFLVALGVTPSTSVEFIESLYQGALQLADRHGAHLVGGDTNRSASGMVVAISLIGVAHKRGPLLRSGAKPGDAVFVTGNVGDSALGLKILQGSGPDVSSRPMHGQLVRRHVEPTPRVEAGRLLVENGLASAAIDLSDGLASDLRNLMRESGVGAAVSTAALPISPEFAACAAELVTDPTNLALSGGEDYELLFTVPPASVPEVERLLPKKGIKVSRIGEVTDRPGELEIEDAAGRRSSSRYGYDHFRAE